MWKMPAKERIQTRSSLITECGKTSLERTSDYQIRKCFPYLDQHRPTFVNAHFLQCHASSNASVRVLQTETYNHNFMVLLLFRAEFHKIASAPDSIRCFINGE